MTSDQRKKLSEIKQFKQLIAYLRDEMGWPINSDSEFDELTYEYTTTELGIDDKSAAQIQEIKRLRPLSAKQPWGVFFVKFEPKKLPVVALRRILGQVALKKRDSANPVDRTMWAQEDLLFISNYGEGDDRQITLAHFSVPTGGHTLPSLKVLGWDSKDTVLHLEAVARELTEQLSWPDDESDAEAWRAKWQAAFTVGHQEVITTSKALSIRLAHLARDIRDRISSALTIETDDGPLTKLMKAFQESLIHDLTPEDFADMYAQTIAYGLLSSRIADPKKKSVDDLAIHMRLSPFLKELMETFLKIGGRNTSAGLDFDELGVGEVVELLDRSNMEAVIADFGDKNPQEDPVIHFYELFLTEYDNDARKSRGVYYTPRPVVAFIVRSLDERLRTEFKLQDGLADTISWGEIAKRHNQIKIPQGVEPSQPFVQILDPATGTGTFLVETIGVIHDTLVQKWRREGNTEKNIVALWNEYVPKHLLPRLHGYELLMAPYAIAHLKISLKLQETKYNFESNERARVYLTNSLVEPSSGNQQLSYSLPALSHEASAVNAIKSHGLFTIVLGNPPYSRDSSNRGDYAESLVQRYKQSVKTERNIQPLSDDYIKFFGLAQQIVEATGCGMIGYITNNSYLTGLIHRGMRAELLGTFSALHIYNLNGGVRDHLEPGDQNVFAIQQGVAIGLFSRLMPEKSNEPRVMYGSITGSKIDKLINLELNTMSSTAVENIASNPPSYSFARSLSDSDQSEYLSFTGVDEWFDFQIAGYKTHRDHIALDFDKAALIRRLKELASTRDDQDLRDEYDVKDNPDWDFASARKALRNIDVEKSVGLTSYRPFDDRWALWGPILMDRPRPGMAELFVSNNIALVCKRQNAIKPFSYALVVNKAFECCIFEGTHGNVMSFPLFAKNEGLFGEGQIPNFRESVLTKIQVLSGLKYTGESDDNDPSSFSARDLFAYLYALLHSNGYRLAYAEQLLQGFPRLPLFRNQALFHRLVEYGRELIQYHLAQDRIKTAGTAEFIGQPRIEKPRWEHGRVLTDKAGLSGFNGVSKEVWDFQVGGYQVCEKWLKDRKGRDLLSSETAHFRQIVGVISLTIDIMKKIDETIVAYGGWPVAFHAEGEPT